MTALRTVKGMHDILPEQVGLWQTLEDRARAVLDAEQAAMIVDAVCASIEALD